MITSISIENLRGIAEGKLEGLAPLTILTGPNASGKSTVLDALLIGGSPKPDEAVGRSVERHPNAFSGSRWLFGNPQQASTIVVSSCSGRSWERKLQYFDYCDENLEEQLIKKKGLPPYSMVHLDEELIAEDRVWSVTGFSSDNQSVHRRTGKGLSDLQLVRLVDPGLPEPLHRTFTELMRAGKRDAVNASLRRLIPGLDQLEILVEAGDIPVVQAMVGQETVPIALSGDGIYAHTQLILNTSVESGALLLIEEPEVYQHPRAIWKTAEILLEAVRGESQVVLTTHNLELIDALIHQATEQDMASMALFNVALKDGKLLNSRRQGDEIRFARDELEKDLR